MCPIFWYLVRPFPRWLHISWYRERGRQEEEKVGGHILEEGAIVAATITSCWESALNTRGKKKTVLISRRHAEGRIELSSKSKVLCNSVLVSSFIILPKFHNWFIEICSKMTKPWFVKFYVLENDFWIWLFHMGFCQCENLNFLWGSFTSKILHLRRFQACFDHNVVFENNAKFYWNSPLERMMRGELTNNPISRANKPITGVQVCIFYQHVTFWWNQSNLYTTSRPDLNIYIFNK